MLDRQYWVNFSEVDSDEQNNLVLSAIHAAIVLDDPDLNKRLIEISKTDPNLKVRAAAQAVRKNKLWFEYNERKRTAK